VRLAGTAAVTLLLGFGTGFMAGQQLGGGEGVVELEVPGAVAISAFCGKATVHGNGTKVSFVTSAAQCEIEAPLSPAMPLRGKLDVSRPGKYRCKHESTQLDCEGPL